MTAAARLDLYAGIHKAMRAMMADLVTAAGRMDPDDGRDVHATLERVAEGLHLAEEHLRLEDRFMHPALEAKRPGASARAALEHAGHEEEFARLREAVADLRAAAGPARRTAAYRLYLALARWMAGNFLHMEYEELHHNPVLWETYTDEELGALHARLLAAVPPPDMMAVQRWMVPSIDHAERVAQFTGLRRGAPAAVFERVLAIARETLGEGDWEKLSRALDDRLAAAA